MYVIFPADEVVYLSYGRLIYVPSVPRTAVPQPLQDPASAPQPQPSSGHSTGSCPSPSIPSTSSSRSFRSTASAPFSNLQPEKAHGEVKKSSSNKELASSKETKQKDTLKVPKLKVPPGKDKRLSYSDFLPVHKCLKPEQQGKRSKTPQVDFDNLFSRREPSHSPEPQRRVTPEKSPTRRKQFFGSAQKPEARVKRTADFGFGMASSESPFRDLTHPHYNELIKGHNGVTFKLIRTVSDFTQQLSQMYEQHADELQHLVANFRKRNGELRKERPACASSLFHTWETLLQEVEIDSQALGDIASILGRQVSRPLLEKSFFRKIQSRKVFTHRESYETIIAKTEEKLVKCRQEYKNAYLLYLTSPSTDTLSAYFDSHNAYVQQLHATNGMLDEYGKETLPQLLQELEEIYKDLCSTLTEAVLQGAEVVSARAMEQCRRYEGLVSQCRNVNGTSDLAHLARSWPAPQGRAPIMKRLFVPPQPPPPPETEEDGPSMPINENIPPPLKDELVIDRLSAVQVKPSHDALRKQAIELDAQIRQIQDALDTTVRLQQRSLEASLFNKANEIQEDISMKRFDLRVAQIHLSAINSQKELFSNKLDNSGDSGRERKMSNASQGSMKTKWLKAFKSLKTPPPETEKKNGSAATRELLKGDPDAHNFQEYTYKKITPCDICSQVLRGHTRQGLKCRICKMNVHVDCQEKASKCQAKARLLRRQKSTSEIETRIPDSTVEDESIGIDERYSGMPTMNRQLSVREVARTTHLSPPQPPHVAVANAIESPEVDLIYQVLKQAGEISNSKGRIETPTVGITLDRGATPSGSGQSLNRRPLAGPAQPPRPQGSNLCVVNPAPCSTSSDRRTSQGPSGSESSMRRRIFAGMKSLTGFGSRSRHGSPGHRSISLPEKRKSTDASGTRPFGQPLMLGPQFENGGNGGGIEESLPPTPPPPSPSPSKGKSSGTLKKGSKSKK